MEIAAVAVAAVDFTPYGRRLLMAPQERADKASPHLVFSQGIGWEDCRTLDPLIDANGSLGVTLGSPTPFQTSRMERHLRTEEALFCMTDPVVLVVAAPTEAEQPRAQDLRAFILRPGTVVVLKKGVWHDACHGVGKASHYYWMAMCIEESASPWIDVEGGPVFVSVEQ